MRLTAALTAITIAAFTLTGCASTPTVSPSPTGSTAPTLTPTPTPEKPDGTYTLPPLPVTAIKAAAIGALGKPEATAIAEIEAAGGTVVIVRRDGKDLPAGKDLDVNAVGLQITKGIASGLSFTPPTP